MPLDFARLEQEVTEMGNVITANIASFKTVAEAMRREADDQVKILALADALDAHAATLAAAIVDQTTPPVVVPPVVVDPGTVPPVEPALPPV